MVKQEDNSSGGAIGPARRRAAKEGLRVPAPSRWSSSGCRLIGRSRSLRQRDILLGLTGRNIESDRLCSKDLRTLIIVKITTYSESFSGAGNKRRLFKWDRTRSGGRSSRMRGAPKWVLNVHPPKQHAGSVSICAALPVSANVLYFKPALQLQW